LQVHNRLPLLEAARVYSFSNLAANTGFVEIVQELQNRARAGDKWAKQTLIEWGRALANVGSGRLPEEKTEDEIRQNGRRRKRDFDRQERIARGKLKLEIEIRRSKLPRAVASDPRRRQEAMREIVNAVLNPSLASNQAPERKAAKNVKEQINKELNRLNM